MKVVGSIRNIYNSRRPVYEALKGEADDFFWAKKRERWHYESRVKDLDSFCLKLETGRFEKPSKLEDFFGASLVVENSRELESAIRLVEEKFEVKYRRPKSDIFTHKEPSQFVFDDIRLYVALPKNPNRRPKGIEDLVFEIQIKTFLQHAWTIATHDLIYKGSAQSWASSRIAFQVKAMLEHAELSIMESEKLRDSVLLKKDNKNFSFQNKISNYIREKWDSAALPSDIIRLAGNVSETIRLMELSWGYVKNVCEKSDYVGQAPLRNLSPYTAIILSVLVADLTLCSVIKEKGKKLFIPEEALELLPIEAVDRVRDISFGAAD